jgi:hypothetical protein
MASSHGSSAFALPEDWRCHRCGCSRAEAIADMPCVRAEAVAGMPRVTAESIAGMPAWRMLVARKRQDQPPVIPSARLSQAIRALAA